MPSLNPASIRKDFPILRESKGKRLIYLDSAATSQKPAQVIDALGNYYSNYNANIHRGIYEISEKATEEYEFARKKIAKFIGAKENEIIFTKNCTESLNLVARFALQLSKSRSSRILLTKMEHHSSIVPWHILQQQRKGITLDWIGITKSWELNMPNYSSLLEKNPSVLSLVHASNVLGTVNPAKKMIKQAHDAGAIAILDGAQSVPHIKINVHDLNCDFLAFSAHKMLGPTGVGVLYIREELHDSISPVFGGGGSISEVLTSSTVFAPSPAKFEPGTPDIGGGIAFGSAIDYLNKIGMEKIENHENELSKYCIKRLGEIRGLEIYGAGAKSRVGVVSFNLKGIHPHDVSTILNDRNICIRAGHHCAQPLHNSLGINASARASFYLYNTKEDVDLLCAGLEKAKRVFA